MKSIKAVMLISLLCLMPTLALADFVADADDTPPVGDFDDVNPSVPEPSGALVMGVALTTVALVARRQRK
jgi:hypothetical protein